MFLLPAARRRIGSSAFYVRRVWFISFASLRSPLTTITIKRFPRFSIRCGSRDRKVQGQIQRAPGRGERSYKNKGRPDLTRDALSFWTLGVNRVIDRPHARR